MLFHLPRIAEDDLAIHSTSHSAIRLVVALSLPRPLARCLVYGRSNDAERRIGMKLGYRRDYLRSRFASVQCLDGHPFGLNGNVAAEVK